MCGLCKSVMQWDFVVFRPIFAFSTFLFWSKETAASVWPYFLRAKAAMLSARLSYRNSVRLSVTWVDQAKTVQAKISKSSSSAAWKTLVSGTVKLFHKFEGGHPERGG